MTRRGGRMGIMGEGVLGIRFVILNVVKNLAECANIDRLCRLRDPSLRSG